MWIGGREFAVSSRTSVTSRSPVRTQAAGLFDSPVQCRSPPARLSPSCIAAEVSSTTLDTALQAGRRHHRHHRWPRTHATTWKGVERSGWPAMTSIRPSIRRKKAHQLHRSVLPVESPGCPWPAAGRPPGSIVMPLRFRLNPCCCQNPTCASDLHPSPWVVHHLRLSLGSFVTVDATPMRRAMDAGRCLAGAVLVAAIADFCPRSALAAVATRKKKIKRQAGEWLFHDGDAGAGSCTHNETPR